MFRRAFQLLAALALLAGSPALAQAPGAPSPAEEQGPSVPEQYIQARGVDVEEHVGQSLPMELVFTNAEGRQVRLGDYFKGAGGKPAIVAMVYYKCPVICTVVMSRLAETINQLDLTVGRDYNALIFSFDPTETTKDARQQKIGFISGYPKEVTKEVEAGWQFHTTTDEAPAHQLAEALGFKYRKLGNGYSHPTALFVITPDGRISRYLYGFDYPARDVKLALLEATQGKLVKTVGERLMFYCFLYDAKAGRYTLAIHRVMQLAGVVTAAALGTLIAALVINEKIKKARVARAARAPKTTDTGPSPIAVVLNQPHHPGGAAS
jgi:protein SCO1